MLARFALPCLLNCCAWLQAQAADEYEWFAQITARPATLVTEDFELTAPFTTIVVANTGNRSWENDKVKPQFSYHLLDESGKVLRYDNKRFEALGNRPGQQTVLQLPAPSDAPPHSGKLVLQLDIVREGVAWFSSANPASRLPSVTLEYRPVSVEQLRENPAFAAAKKLVTGDKDIDLATSLAFYTLHKAQSKIATAYGEYTLLNAGSRYPQAWIRDCATGIDAAFLVLGDADAKSCVLMHLEQQHADGYVNDWIDAKNEVDKNTVESDQESSLVIATARYVDRAHAAFLAVKVGDATVLEHLRRALEYVWTQKRDASSQLVVSGHTIDWGDVSIEEPDQKAIYLSPRSHLVAGIYSNAIYVLAIRDYLHLLSLALHGHERERRLWKKRQVFLKTAINNSLWNADEGWYVMHRHVTPFKLSVDEDAMFPMGGNALAIQAGIADTGQANRIYANSLRLQKRYGAATISGVLYPPFPDGTYLHPAVNREYHYQNGGLWDWFGLRLLRTMFNTGHAETACRSLKEIAAKVVRNRTFSEWDDLNGHAEGGKDYLGAAGEYIATVQELNSYVALKRRQAPDFSARALCGQAPAAGNAHTR